MNWFGFSDSQILKAEPFKVNTVKVRLCVRLFVLRLCQKAGGEERVYT